MGKSDFSDKIKQKFFQAVTMPILLHGCTTWTLGKHLEKKVKWELQKDAMSCFEQILESTLHKTASTWALIFNLKNHQSKMNNIHRTLLGKNKLISDIFSSTRRHGPTSVSRPAKIYIHQFYADTECSLEDLIRMMVV